MANGRRRAGPGEDLESLDLPAAGHDRLPPSPGGEIEALGNIGYALWDALADLIDNSIDAGAKNVVVRFVHDDDTVIRVVIADDGRGMTGIELRRAMVIGNKREHGPRDLGMYGTGLKTASISQAEKFSVVTLKGGKASGRYWSENEVKAEGWLCGIIATDRCEKLLGVSWAPVRIRKRGTLVVWDQVKRSYEGKNGCEGYLKGLLPRIALHLGLCFHRFIEENRLAIHLQAKRIGKIAPSSSIAVKPINPFSYPKSGNKHYPKKFTVALGEKAKLVVEAHIWPPRSKGVEYKLGGQTASRQGFYFYRNMRLLQAGGWNKVRSFDSEPHMSLARVRVELTPEMDRYFRPVTMKNTLKVPHGFAEAVQNSRCGDVTWRDYERDALDAYKRRPLDRGEVVLVPGAGFPEAVRRRAKKAFDAKPRSSDAIRYRFVSMDAGKVFEVDRDSRVIRVNKDLRRRLDRGADGNGAFRTALFLLLLEEFRHQRAAKKRERWLEHCNQLIAAAL